MQQRRLGSQGLRGLRRGPRVHGDEPVLRPRRRGRIHRHHPSRPRPGGHLPRHRRHVRALHQRAAGGTGDRRPARPGGARHQVRQRAPRGRLLGRRQRPPRVRAPLLRCLARAARHRPHRPLLPAPGRHHASPSRRPGARWRSWSPPARCAASASPRRRPPPSGGPTPPTRSPPCRASTRSSPATRRRRCCPPAASWASASSPTARSAAGSSPAPSPAPRSSPADDFRGQHAALPGREPRPATSSWWRGSARWRTGKGCTPAQLALAWVLAQGEDVVPIPGTKRRRCLEENVAALSVELTPEDVAAIEAIAPPGRGGGRPLHRRSTWPGCNV